MHETDKDAILALIKEVTDKAAELEKKYDVVEKDMSKLYKSLYNLKMKIEGLDANPRSGTVRGPV